ncbi:MAG: PCYCGC motif-containing (lipo)protein [Vicinamibacterales bacterium]
MLADLRARPQSVGRRLFDWREDRATARQGHRVECAMCVNVALESTRMLETGRSVREVREAMDAKHSRYLKWSTATPPVR